MNYLTDQLESVCKTETVALSAGYTQVDWANHVQVSFTDDDFSGPINMGRLPMVIIREVSTDYVLDAENGGTRDADFIIRIYVHVFKSRQREQSEVLHKIKQAILSELKNSGIENVDNRSTRVETTPYAMYLDITIQSQTSFGLDYGEE